ncbi:MAG: hypothetical protein JST85_22910 [Acidobacteria bacterium]|nr:hypothetical protein [Acidobacteriota bacterium]
MASNDSTVSLLFKIVADSGQARGDFSSFQNFLKSGLGTLRSLFDELSNAGQFKQLKEAGQNLAPTLKGIGKDAVEAAESLEGMALAGSLVGLALAAIPALSAGAIAVIAGLAANAANADEKIFDLTQQTNFSAQSLAAMQLAADTSGTSIQKVGSFIAQFEEKLADAAAGNKELATAFKQLGVNAAEGLRNPQAAFDQFLKSFNQLSDDAAKVQLLKKIGGSAGLIQFLKEGSDGIDSFVEKAKSLGIVLPNTFNAQAADRFNDTLTDLRSQFDNLFVTVGRQLLPVLQPLLEKVSNKLAEMGPQAQRFGDALASGVQYGIDLTGDLATVVDTVRTAISGVIQAISDTIETLEGGTDDSVSNVEKIEDSFGSLRATIYGVAGGIAVIADSGRLLGDLLLGVIKEISLAAVEGINGVLNFFGFASETMLKEITRLRNDLKLLEEDFNRGGALTNRVRELEAQARQKSDPLKQLSDEGFAPVGDTPKKAAKPAGPAGKSAKDEREAEAKAELKLLELAEKQKELIFRAETDAVKANLAQQLISHQTATEQLIRIEQVRLQARLEFLAEERRQVEASALKSRDKDVKLGELSLKEAEERQRSEQTINQIREQQRQRDEQAERDHRQRLLDLALAADRQEIDRIRDLADQRVVSGVNAEKRIAEIEQQSFDRRRAALEQQKQTVGPDANDFQKLTDEIAKLESERAAAVEQASARIRAAREREIADQRAFQQALTQAERDLVAKQIELEAQRIDAAERRATTPTERTAIINARAANEQKAEDLRHEQNLANLRQQEDDLQAQATTYDEVLRVTELFNQEFEQEQERHVQAVKELQQQLSEAQAAQDPTSNVNLFGITDESASRFDAFKQSALGALGEVALAGGNFKDTLKSAFSAVASAAQSVLSAFILTGKGGGQAFKQLAADIIASLAIQSAVKAIFELAEGFAAQANFQYVQAAQHFAAAKLYAVVAGAAAAVGIGIGAAGGLGGGQNDNQAQGAGAFGGQQRSPQDSKFQFGDVRGKLGQDPELQDFFKNGRGIFGDQLDRMREELARQRESTDRLSEATNRHADAAEQLVTRINSVPPEDVLSVAVDRAPEHIGRGFDAATSSNADVTRNLALKLGLS